MSLPFTVVTSVAAPLIEDNIDTDIIIPSREMKSTGKTGLAAGLFAGRRYLADRSENPDFVLNQPAYRAAAILLAGDNFGCGSSREHAVWALAEYGIRAVIAPSFSPIFAGNAVRRGVLPLVLPRASIASLIIFKGAISIDLPAQTVCAGNATHRFEIGAEALAMLIGGLDAIDLTQLSAGRIAAWQAGNQSVRPWVYLSSRTDFNT